MSNDKASPFKQIGVGRDGLFALDEQGGVWRYYPADKSKGAYAAWYKLTGYRKDNTGRYSPRREAEQAVVHVFVKSPLQDSTCAACNKPLNDPIHVIITEDIPHE